MRLQNKYLKIIELNLIIQVIFLMYYYSYFISIISFVLLIVHFPCSGLIFFFSRAGLLLQMPGSVLLASLPRVKALQALSQKSKTAFL